MAQRQVSLNGWRTIQQTPGANNCRGFPSGFGVFYNNRKLFSDLRNIGCILTFSHNPY
jgi:hypothetical protein